MTSLKRAAPKGDATSLSSKVYVQTTRAGKVRKIVREVYLRQDIPCSSKLCSICSPTLTSTRRPIPFVLAEKPAGTKVYPKGHYLIPDTNAFLNAMDLFETESNFKDVIVLQTVLEEVKNRSLPLYNRLVALTNNDEKHYYVFFNEFRMETYVQRESGESINDRNDRAVRKAVQWYQEHLKTAAKKRKMNCPAVVMLSDDKANLEQAKAIGIHSANLRNYVDSLENAEGLMDLVAESRDQDSFKSRGGNIYPEHYSLSKLMTGVKAGTMHQGTFSVSRYNYLEGFVHVAAFDKPLLILGRENSNRAVAGDVIVVEVLPQDQWKAPSSTIVEEDAVNKNDNPDAEEGEAVISAKERKILQDEVKRAHESSSETRAQPTARVVGITKRNWRQYVGHIDNDSVRNTDKLSRSIQNVFLIPMDKRIPKIRLRTRQAGDLVGKRVVVAIDAWDRDSRYPVGHFVRSLGELESKAAETEALLLEYDVQYRPFAKAVLDCLPPEGHDWKVPADTNDPGWNGRRDLRHLDICSIDPPGCTDIDDALHAYELPNGNYAVGVHIADVSHFVKADTAIDREASMRGTTVYLVDKRIDMLPMLLGTDLCSIQPFVERYAFSVLWELTPNADVVSVDFTKSVIRSRMNFTYEQAQMRIDDSKQQDDLTKGMRILLHISQRLRANRMAAGALNLASPEVRIEMDSETSDPIDVKTKALLATNSLVEEFMLLANIAVATKIQDSFPATALLRRHANPPKTNFEDLALQLRVKKNMALSVDSSKALADSLDACVDPADPYFNTLVRMMATRCMMAAEYFCAGTLSPPEFRHYGLASPIYTHFTSPIRRYADLAVHRQLAAAIGYEKLHDSLTSRNRLVAVCGNINVRHRNAQFAGRASVEYYVGQALKGQDVVTEGYVVRVFVNGVVVFVPKFGIEGTVKVRDMGVEGEEGVEFDPEEWVLTVKGDKERRLELFEQVMVRIVDEVEKSTGKRKVKMTLV